MTGCKLDNATLVAVQDGSPHAEREGFATGSLYVLESLVSELLKHYRKTEREDEDELD